MLITYLRPNNQEIVQNMPYESESGETSGEEGRGGAGVGHNSWDEEAGGGDGEPQTDQTPPHRDK